MDQSLRLGYGGGEYSERRIAIGDIEGGSLSPLVAHNKTNKMIWCDPLSAVRPAVPCVANLLTHNCAEPGHHPMSVPTPVAPTGTTVHNRHPGHWLYLMYRESFSSSHCRITSQTGSHRFPSSVGLVERERIDSVVNVEPAPAGLKARCDVHGALLENLYPKCPKGCRFVPVS
jgi:hypothetical protein